MQYTVVFLAELSCTLLAVINRAEFDVSLWENSSAVQFEREGNETASVDVTAVRCAQFILSIQWCSACAGLHMSSTALCPWQSITVPLRTRIRSWTEF